MDMFHRNRFLCPHHRGCYPIHLAWVVRPGNIEYRAVLPIFYRSTDMPSTSCNSLGFHFDYKSNPRTSLRVRSSSYASHQPRFSNIGQDNDTFSCPVGHRRRTLYHNWHYMMPWHYLNLEPFSYMRTAPLLLDINRTYSTSLRLGHSPNVPRRGSRDIPRRGPTTDRRAG